MRTLKRGDSGEAVKAVQRILGGLGLFDGELGGNFGPITEQAVVGFQHLHSGPSGSRLQSTGTVTESTWWALQNPAVARNELPTLAKGSSGEDVKILQRLLTARGVFAGAVLGNYGELTTDAVVAFQIKHAGPKGIALEGDGVVGSDTWWALLHPAASRAATEVVRPALRPEDRGPEVIELQKFLVQQGTLKSEPTGYFGKLTTEAVSYFQETHLGPDGQFLAVDGIVGPATWWALRNPSGRPQASHLRWDIPEGIEGLRRRQLEIVLNERQAGVRERPDGANWGGGVERYRGVKGAPWCCYFWSWGTKEALGRYPLGAKLGRCMTAWTRAEARGMAHSKGAYVPIPGDAFVMLYSKAGNFTGRGHIGFVLRVEVVGGAATAIDTVEGNAGNRVKVGHRSLNAPTIVGFINPYPPNAQPAEWQFGLGTTDVGGRDTTT